MQEMKGSLIGFKPWGPTPVHPPPKLILHVATRAGKEERLCWRKKKIDWVFIYS